LAISKPVLFLKNIAIPILYQYFPITKFKFIELEYMLRLLIL